MLETTEQEREMERDCDDALVRRLCCDVDTLVDGLRDAAGRLGAAAEYWERGEGTEGNDKLYLKAMRVWVRQASDILGSAGRKEGTCIGNPPCEDGSCQACQDGHSKPTTAKRDQPGYDSLTDVQKAFYDGYDEGYKAGKEATWPRRANTTQ